MREGGRETERGREGGRETERGREGGRERERKVVNEETEKSYKGARWTEALIV